MYSQVLKNVFRGASGLVGGEDRLRPEGRQQAQDFLIALSAANRLYGHMVIRRHYAEFRI